MTKYRAIPTTVDGIRFASKKEAARYQELRLLMKAERIAELCLQPAFPIVMRGITVARYIADFQYIDLDRSGQLVIEDVKGMRTPTYKLKKKLVEAQYGIQISEV